jgi:hypothetical protein
MTADEAAASWTNRAMEILTDYRSTGASITLWNQSGIAAQGAQALLENRYNELSPGAQDELRRVIAAMADVNAKSAGAAMGSPLSDGVEEFYSEVRRRSIAGGTAVAQAAKIAGVGAIGIAGVALILYAILVLRR